MNHSEKMRVKRRKRAEVHKSINQFSTLICLVVRIYEDHKVKAEEQRKTTFDWSGFHVLGKVL